MSNYEHGLTPVTKKMWEDKIKAETSNVFPICQPDVRTAQERLDHFRGLNK